MKPLLIIQLPASATSAQAKELANSAQLAHPDYEFLFISHGATLSIAHEGNINVTHVLQAPTTSQGT